MYAKFNLTLTLSDINNQTNTSEINIPSYLSDIKNTIHKELKDNLLSNGDLDAEKMLSSWFPNVSCDIFLSHSHKDEKLATAIAVWLYEKHSIKCFIDSSIWGFCNDLLKSIDDNYCKNIDGQTYNYNQRNISTAHVHMMLASALNMMIDNCECLIFLNTSNSINPTDSMSSKSNNTTYSPWIYGELSSSKLLRRKPLQVHRPSIKNESFDAVFAESLRIAYPAPLDHLENMDVNSFFSWSKKVSANKYKALDSLYKKYSITD